MTCTEFATALLDDGVDRLPGFQRHLAGCAACQELESAHRAALPLKHLELESPRPVSLAEVRSAGRRRRATMATVGALAAAAVVAWAFLPREAPSEVAEPVPVVEGIPLPSMPSLIAEVSTYARRDPTVRDPTYRAFGGLSVWLAPPRSHALESPPIRQALYPLQQHMEVAR
jgi:hypothetical protein